MIPPGAIHALNACTYAAAIRTNAICFFLILWKSVDGGLEELRGTRRKRALSSDGRQVGDEMKRGERKKEGPHVH